MTTRWNGLAVAPGVALAASWRADRSAAPTVTGATGGSPLGGRQVEQAFQAVAAELDRIARHATAQGRRAAGDIVAANAEIARDATLIDAAAHAAGAVTSDDPMHVMQAIQAVHEVVELHARVLEELPDPTLRERAADVRGIGRRVVDWLARGTADAPIAPPSRFVLVAVEIGPADLLELLERAGGGLAAAVAVRGGANAHAAVIARSIGLPMITGIAPVLLELPDGTPLLVDASRGLVVASPGDREVEDARGAARSEERRSAALTADRGRRHVTADGQLFILLVNVAAGFEARTGIDAGAQGIGLLRTELALPPSAVADRWPVEADHRRALGPVFAAVRASSVPITARLLDFTGDKAPPFLARRGNGQVGLAALLADPDALAAQLRAILDLGRRLDLRILVPMVTAAEQLRMVRAMVTAVAGDLSTPVPPVGAMVETVAAVQAIDDLLSAADFLSVGTNDLAGEVLDMGRGDPRARPELAAHPHVLRLVGRVAAASVRAGCEVSICGDAAADSRVLPLLVGAGIRAFSVGCSRVDRIRYLLRRLDADRCAKLFVEALGCDDAADVLALVAGWAEASLP